VTAVRKTKRKKRINTGGNWMADPDGQLRALYIKTSSPEMAFPIVQGTKDSKGIKERRVRGNAFFENGLPERVSAGADPGRNRRS